MSSLGSLVVSLAANTAQFTSDLGKAAHLSEKRMEQITKSAKRAGAAMGAAFVAGAGAAAVMVKNAINNADEMGKMAQKAGVSVEAFTSLAYAADFAGVQSGTLQSAMSKLSQTLHDVAAGKGENAASALKTLGISATDASGRLKNADQIMMDVAEQFAKYEDGAGKTALAIKIFGESGVALIPLLNSGRDGLQSMREEAKELGVTLDGSLIPAAEAVNDNLTRLGYVKKGLANEIMRALLPSLQGLTDHLVASSKESGALAEAATVAATGVKLLISGGILVAAVFKNVGQVLGGVAASIVRMFSGDFQGAMDTALATVDDSVDGMTGTLKLVNSVWSEEVKKIAETSRKANLPSPLGKAAQDAEKDAKKIADMIANLRQQYESLGKTASEVELLKLEKAGAGESAMKEARMILALTDAKKKEIAVMEEAKKLYEDTRTPLEQYQTTIARLNELVQQGAIDWDTYGRAVAKAQDTLDGLENAKNGIAELQKSVEGWGKQFTDTFVDGVVKGKLSFTDLANSIIKDILRIIVQKQVLNALGDFGGSGKAGTGILGMIGSAFGGGRALGGDVKAGTTYLVGERGPETFTPSVSGSITPNAGATIHFAPVYQIDARSDRMAVRQDMERISRQTNAELVEKLQRQGRI